MSSIWNRIKLAITARERRTWEKAKASGLKRHVLVNGVYKGIVFGIFFLSLSYINSINFRFKFFSLETLLGKYLIWLPAVVLIAIIFVVLSYYDLESKYGNAETKQ